MPEPASIVDRYDTALKKLSEIGPHDFERGRIGRLRQDIDSFSRDLKFLDEEDGILILAPDAAEIVSYIEPRLSLGLYCFPLEDRAAFDWRYAQAHDRETAFKKSVETRKIARRILRARAHLFNIARPNILLPPYLGELKFALSRILAGRRADDLDAVFDMIERNVARLDEENAELLRGLAEFDTLGAEERRQVLETVFEKIVASPIDFADDMSVDERARRISTMARANDFLLRTRSFALEEYDWGAVLERQQANLLRRLHDLTPDETLIQYIDNLFNALPRSSRTSFAVYSDARALAYLAAINGELQARTGRPVRVQLVTWALSPVTVARALWPEEQEALVQVRHPKLLAAAIDFRHPNVRRSQVVSDLERFAEALNLFEASSDDEGDEKRDKQLDQVRVSWEQLDDTLLAWTAPIGRKPVPADRRTERVYSLEAIRQVVVRNRSEFEEYLTKKIDSVSKSLSDSHWLMVVQPNKVEDVQADRLLYEPGRYIILRSREDQARFAIALYSKDIIEYLEESVARPRSFGTALVALTQRHDGEEERRDVDPGRRAETQLLKACLFAILGDNVLAARYCGLAKVELGPSEDAYHAGIRAEIFYLAHYAHRCLGIEKRSAEEFRVCLRRLEASNAEWKPSELDPHRRFRPRYFASWMTTCREISALEGMEFHLDSRLRDPAKRAYQGCLDVLADVAALGGGGDTLAKYHAGRATQNVMFVYTFHKLGIGSWRRSFGDVIEPTDADAHRAWEVMKAIRASGNDGFPGNMKRNDLAYCVGTFWFAKTSEERRAAGEKLRAMEPEFERDRTMLRVISGLIGNPDSGSE